MKFIVKFFLHIIENLTLDYIPAYFNHYYIFNSDKSGFLMPSKHSPVDREVVYYSVDVGSDVYDVREKYVSETYRSSFVSSTIAHLAAIVAILLVSPGVFTGVALYVLVAVLAKFIITVFEAFYIIATGKRSASPDYLILTVSGGLGVKSGMADRVRAVTFIDTFKGSDNLTNAERFERNNNAIRLRTFV